MNEKRNTAQTKLMTLQQASQEYGPPYTSLRDLVVRGDLPGVRFGEGRRIWVRRSDLDTLIERSALEHA
jgi:hypothetical protein